MMNLLSFQLSAHFVVHDHVIHLWWLFQSLQLLKTIYLSLLVHDHVDVHDCVNLLFLKKWLFQKL